MLSAPFSLTLVAILAFLVALDGHNPFYTQQRVGRNGRYFRIWKLRTMVPDADQILESYLARHPEARKEWDRDQKLRHDPRITRVGRVLRKLSLDEVPQLLNVFNGTMSLVGPRPMMIAQQLFYCGEAYYRLRPGITGPWQVSDRNECEFVGRVAYDERYDEDLSLATDLRVLFRTVSVVIRGTGC
ncbi:lipopolysaccharide/colanic/teichoic acid biosynthesis glycosyltransferase [Rhodovulum visakhapatnamense]|uniref:Lipopolysaccharide/colanic/teichoic acid biosynthesis glycosyltransferase n=2 Tax=Rhodovulum visakhapatnamense TaxID=364297 RepID=A0A4R8FHF4_9RHOB|nr:lipopolysaccharide/colanic/teichoic acid biosynthesis glycosyltransferase [Rhodovulum visakhapatnamense]